MFKSYISLNGDSYDRFLLRMFEMGESLNIVNQCLNSFNKFSKDKLFVNNRKLSGSTIPNLLNFSSIVSNSKQYSNNFNMYSYMEDLIEHFINWHSGLFFKSNTVYITIESPKGEFGVGLVSDNSSKPFRCKIRSPSYHNLQFLPKMVKGHLLADLAAIIGTIDIVFGEIDR
jgi:NADH:ubiquinone oxidoreductase subunit D